MSYLPTDDDYDALRSAVRELADAVAEDIQRSSGFRLIERAADRLDALPVIGPLLRLLDRAPRWMVFGTREFLYAYGALYLAVTLAVIAVTLIGYLRG